MTQSASANLAENRTVPIKSLKARYFAKLVSNLAALVISLAVSILVPRTLGPAAFGDYNFLFNFFQQLLPFLTFSTTTGFFIKLSQRPDEFGLVSYYTFLTLVAFSAMFLFIGVCSFFGIASHFWYEIDQKTIFIAAIFGALAWLVTLLVQIADAYGLTFKTEIAQILLKCIGLVLLGFLVWSKSLDLTNYFYYQILLSTLICLVLTHIIHRSGFKFTRSWLIKKAEIWRYTKEFYDYTKPIFLYSIFGLFVGLLDRAVLQNYGGSTEQGYFGLAQSLGNICFIFTSSIIAIIMREFSIASHKNDLDKISRMSRRFMPLLFAVAAYFGCFLSSQSDKASIILGGEKFLGANLALMLWALYPIHQTYGQLTGAICFSTNRTSTYSKIGIFSMFIGLPMVYFALAPIDQSGFAGGATGLAVKFLLNQFIGVNLVLYFVCRVLKMKFWYYFAHQIVTVGCFLSLAYISKILVDQFLMARANMISQFFVGGLIYTVLIVSISFAIPQFFGLNKHERSSLLKKILLKF